MSTFSSAETLVPSPYGDLDVTSVSGKADSATNTGSGMRYDVVKHHSGEVMTIVVDVAKEQLLLEYYTALDHLREDWARLIMGTKPDNVRVSNLHRMRFEWAPRAVASREPAWLALAPTFLKKKWFEKSHAAAIAAIRKPFLQKKRALDQRYVPLLGLPTRRGALFDYVLPECRSTLLDSWPAWYLGQKPHRADQLLLANKNAWHVVIDIYGPSGSHIAGLEWKEKHSKVRETGTGFWTQLP